MKRKSGRIVGIVGLPCSGKSTIVRALMESSNELIARVGTGDIVRQIATDSDNMHMAAGNLYQDETRIRLEIEKLVNLRRSQGAEVIIIDSAPRFDDQLMWMIGQQWLGGDDDGVIVQVRGEMLVQRAIDRSRDNQDSVEMIVQKIAKQQELIDAMEKHIFRIGIPYHTVMNHDAVQATAHFANIIGVRK